MSDPICPHCGNKAGLVTGVDIYWHRPDLKHLNFWACIPCDAYVGCHKEHPVYSPDGTTPLGTLANSELRQLRGEVHKKIDPVWKAGKISRGKVYKRLASALGITKEECHIAMFDEERCKEALRLHNSFAYTG